MTVGEGQDDDALAGVARLRTFDVPPRHEHRLRRRCHALLQTQTRPTRSTGAVSGTPFRRLVAPGLGGAWCVAYVVEIVRIAAAVYLRAQ